MFVVCLSTNLFLCIASILSYGIYQIDARSTTGLSKNAIYATLNKKIDLNVITDVNFSDLIITESTLDNELVHKIIYIKSHKNDYYNQITSIIESTSNFPIVLLGKNVFRRYENEGRFHFRGKDFTDIYQVESDIASYNNNCFIIEKKAQDTYVKIY